MSGSPIANANPLDAGANANSVESAAVEFDRMFADTEPTEVNREGKTTKIGSRPSEPRRARRDDDEDAGDAPDPDDEDGHSPEGDIDPILGNIPDPKPGDADDEDEGEEDDADSDDEDDSDDDLDTEFDVTVAGEVKKVPLKEIIAGYSREADYRVKTAALAEERRELEEYANETVQERQTYSETLQTWIDYTAALEPSQTDWETLRKANPDLYITTKEQWDGIRVKVNEAKAEMAKLVARQEKDATRARNQFVRDENVKLAQAVPALANPKKAKAFRETIFTYAKRAGYSEDEILTGAVDHRDVLTLYKAARYDEIMRSRKTGQRSGSGRPELKTSASSKPRNISKSSGNRSQVRDAERRLARTGSVNDAAMAFTAMLKNER